MERVSFIYTLIWYLYLLSIGLIFFPISSLLFKKFWDKGYAFTKIIGIILLSYSFFISGFIIPLSRALILLILSIFFLLNLYLIKKKKIKINIKRIIFIEILFFFSYIFWAYIRGQNPDIHGLEKFMDFGFINSILRARKFPPLDIWLSSTSTVTNYINYYYFGHLETAVLIKITEIPSYFGYNSMLATLFGLGVIETFSLSASIIKNIVPKIKTPAIIATGILGAYLTNLAGNLHTIYIFTKGYKGDFPVPFWEIFSLKPHPELYWYPNATRFIYHTIHEFPSYSYVVADLHGHVFDIPAVILTLALVYSLIFLKKKIKPYIVVILGFLVSVHYMTNAFDAPIYLLFISVAFFLEEKKIKENLKNIVLLLITFFVFSFPFSMHFKPFSHQIGLNCPPHFLANIGKLGPFVFIYENCQLSPFWMLAILWGFFWINFILLFLKKGKKIIDKKFIFITYLFTYGIFLILIPEFFYAKDIYPTYFRANTMFKLGYQTFIMSSIASAISFSIKTKRLKTDLLLKFLALPFFILVSIYPFLAVPSYYGKLHKISSLDGERWVKTMYPSIKEAIDWLNNNVKGQPTIIEAQGDSYTDYNLISSYTGLPTVGGWYVHEWLWRGSPNVEGKRVNDIKTLYITKDINLTKRIIKKFRIKYIIVSPLEVKKYTLLYTQKFKLIGKEVFTSSNGKTTIYKTDL